MKEMKYGIVVLLVVVINACSQRVEIKSPPGYDLNKPEVFTMPAVLQEISGIAFKNGNADTVYAQQDEDGKVFLLKPGDKEAAVIKFGRKGDYEDIGIHNDTVVMLRSDGTLYLFSLNAVKDGAAGPVLEIKDVVPAGEYEAMYVDDNDGAIYMLCKECPGSKKSKGMNGYRVSVSANGEITTATFSIDETTIEALSGKKKINLKPSAITKNSQTGEWYIFSAINKMLVVTDAAWKVTAVYPLSPASLFMQPEGIAFDRDNNLYISNEGEAMSAGTILKFAYQKN